MTVSWRVEIINPYNEDILKMYEDKSIQNIVKRWHDETNNNYLTSTKLFNIFHHKKTEGLIKVYKFDTKVSTDSDSE